MRIPCQINSLLAALFSSLLLLAFSYNAAAAKDPLADLDPSVINSKPFKRAYWEFYPRAYPLDHIPKGAKARAAKQLKEFKDKKSASTFSATSGALVAPLALTGTGTWFNIGAAPILPQRHVGRIADIAVDPIDTNHWLIGAASGGVWETRDAGISWVPKTDDQASLPAGAIAFAPSNPNIIYVGTGEGVYSGHAGAGLLKSIDGGTTWQLLGELTHASNAFNDIKVLPSNPDVLVASTTYGLFGRSLQIDPSRPPSGIFKSTNGGITWSQKLTGYGSDLEVHSADFSRQFAAMQDASNIGSVYRSLDSGETWAVISGPWTATPTQVARVELALSPSNPNILYVSIQNASGGAPLGFWKTENAWSVSPQWTAIAVPSLMSSERQWFYNHDILVDPSNPNIFYTGGVYLYKYDAGTWTQVPAGHPDQQTLAFAGTRLLIGNDGGIYSSSDGGISSITHNTNLSITQFYEGSIHPSNPDIAMAGSQDNATPMWQGSNSWKMAYPWGDGADNAFSTTSPDTHWAVSAQGHEISRTTNGGTSFSSVTSGLPSQRQFIGRFEMCPSNPDIFIANTNPVARVNDFFSGAAPTWFLNGSDIPGGNTAVAFASSDTSCNSYASAGQGGDVYLTRNGGATWDFLDLNDAVPNRYVTALAFDPTNANILYVALSGFDEGTPGQPGHLFKTTNALAATPTWANISPPVNIPHNSIALDPAAPSTLYVGTDIGVWVSTDGGTNWNHMGPETGMPNVPVYEIKINPATNRAVAFTYGRGAFAMGPAAPILPDLGNFWTLPPASAALGQTIPLADMVCNRGNGAAGSFTISFYTAPVGSYVGTPETTLGSRSVPGLAAGACSTGNTSITTPTSLTPGGYYVRTVVDSGNQVTETSEGNNESYYSSIQFHNGADLAVTAISGPASSTGTVTISYTITNQGTGTAAASNVGFYLSTDATYSANDMLATTRSVASLAAGTSTSSSVSMGFVSGRYYVIARADYSEAVAESNEGNNTTASNRIAVSTGADLTMTGVSGPSAAVSGTTINVTESLKNQGTGSSGPYYIGIYLSTDRTITSADTLIGRQYITDSTNGITYTFNSTFRIPANIAAGTYYYGAIADDTDLVPESNETNNATRGGTLKLTAGPDLVTTGLSGPASGTAGNAITLSSTVKNQGVGTTGTFLIGFYLSTDNIITTADTFMGSRSISNLVDGDSSSGNTTVTIPNVAGGTYYLGAIADYSNQAPESIETNNALTASPITITAAPPTGPDLIMTAISGPTTAVRGTSVTLANTVANQGVGSAGPFSIGFYLSADTVITTSDIFVGSRAVSSLAAGANNSASTALTIPATTATGQYYWGTIADYNSQVAESSESNNGKASAVTVRITK